MEVLRLAGAYGVSSCVNKGLSRAELIAAIAAAGFRHVELYVDPESPESWAHDPAAMRGQLHEAGLTPCSLHTPVQAWKNNHPDDAVRRASVEAAAACFVPAKELGVEVIVTHPTSPDSPLTDEEYPANFQRARESLTELAGRAATVGVRLAVENLPARGKPRPGAAVGEVLELIEGLGETVGVCLDAGHSNANGRDAAEEVRLGGDRVIAVHIQDNDGKGEDLHWMPGRGTTDWDSLVRALDEIGFEAPRVFEIPSRRGEVPATLDRLAELARRWSEKR
jgi:sugar phosphate isomerase/epimerase